MRGVRLPLRSVTARDGPWREQKIGNGDRGNVGILQVNCRYYNGLRVIEIGIKVGYDRHMSAVETPARIEPCHLTTLPGELADVVGEVIAASTRLGDRLHSETAASLRELVVVMNCYYSNLIEGHNTRPRDIERALTEELADDEARRELQLEARAHIRVQRKLDRQHEAGELGEPATREFIRGLHRDFYEWAPAAALRIDSTKGSFVMAAGSFRSLAVHDNTVGRHHPPSSERVDEFMEYFEERYRFEGLGRVSAVVATAAAHHRLNYIHPFPDGNGRVSRLMSHAMMLKADIGAKGLWSISRGMARGLSDGAEYKRMMDAADSPRKGDLDGRGNLSEQALVEYVLWFSRIALDQLTFMTALFDFDTLSGRLSAYAMAELGVAEDVGRVLSEVFRHGSVARGQVAQLTGRSERSARDQLKLLTEGGLLASESGNLNS